MKATINDVHSYSVFANIDNRKGSIEGYQLLLSKEQIEKIEDIVLERDLRVADKSAYEVVDDKG